MSADRISSENASTQWLVKADILYLIASPEKTIHNGQAVEIIVKDLLESFGVDEDHIKEQCFIIIFQKPFLLHYTDEIKVYKTTCMDYSTRFKSQITYAVILAKVNSTDIRSERLLTWWHVDADLVDVLFLPPSQIPYNGNKLNLFVHSVIHTFLVPAEEIKNHLFLLIYRKEFTPVYSEWIDAIECKEIEVR